MTTDFARVAHLRVTQMPTDADLGLIPLSRAGEFELSDRECKRLRSRIYKLNRHNAAGRRWRTMKNGPILMVWRIA